MVSNAVGSGFREVLVQIQKWEKKEPDFPTALKCSVIVLRATMETAESAVKNALKLRGSDRFDDWIAAEGETAELLKGLKNLALACFNHSMLLPNDVSNGHDQAFDRALGWQCNAMELVIRESEEEVLGTDPDFLSESMNKEYGPIMRHLVRLEKRIESGRANIPTTVPPDRKKFFEDLKRITITVSQKVKEWKDQTPVIETKAAGDRLGFDDDTKTVILDGTRYRVENEKAYRIVKIVAGKKKNVTDKLLAKRLGVNQHQVKRLKDKLGPDLQKLIGRTQGRACRLTLPDLGAE